jgi:hypothetical protein
LPPPEGKSSFSAAEASPGEEGRQAARQAAIEHLKACVAILEKQLATGVHPYSQNINIFICELQSILYLLTEKQLTAEEIVPRLFDRNLSGLLTNRAWKIWGGRGWTEVAGLGIPVVLICSDLGGHSVYDPSRTLSENLFALPGWDNRIRESSMNKEKVEEGWPMCSGSSPTRVIFRELVLVENPGRADGALLVVCGREIAQLGHGLSMARAVTEPPLKLDKLKPISPGETRSGLCYYPVMPSDLAKLPAVAVAPKEGKGK